MSRTTKTLLLAIVAFCLLGGLAAAQTSAGARGAAAAANATAGVGGASAPAGAAATAGQSGVGTSAGIAGRASSSTGGLASEGLFEEHQPGIR